MGCVEGERLIYIMATDMKVYETEKMRVEIYDTEVIKTFKDSPSSKSRYKLERDVLERLKGIDGFPKIINAQDKIKTITMSYVEGDNKSQLSDYSLLKLRTLVAEMLGAGVARHAIPERDLLINDSGDVSMVDFERATLRKHRFSIGWFIAQGVTRYHLLRIIWNHNSALLSPEETLVLKKFTNIRNKLQKLKLVRSFFRKFYRSKSKPGHYTTKFKRNNIRKT